METCLETGNALISDLIEEATGSSPVAPIHSISVLLLTLTHALLQHTLCIRIFVSYISSYTLLFPCNSSGTRCMPPEAASERRGMNWGHPRPRQEDCVPLLNTDGSRY